MSLVVSASDLLYVSRCSTLIAQLACYLSMLTCVLAYHRVVPSETFIDCWIRTFTRSWPITDCILGLVLLGKYVFLLLYVLCLH